MPAGEAPPPDAVAPEGHKSSPGAGAMHGDHTIHRILTRPAAAAHAIEHGSPLAIVIAAVVLVAMLFGPGFLLPLIGPRSRRPTRGAAVATAPKPNAAPTMPRAAAAPKPDAAPTMPRAAAAPVTPGADGQGKPGDRPASSPRKPDAPRPHAPRARTVRPQPRIHATTHGVRPPRT
jgi:hypothetical protein